MDSLDLRWLEDGVEEVSGWGGIGFPLMHLSIKLSHVILMNMKYKAQSSREKSRDGAALRGVSWKRNNNVCWWMKNLVVLFVCFYFVGTKIIKKKDILTHQSSEGDPQKVAHFWSGPPVPTNSNKFYFLPFVRRAKRKVRQSYLLTFRTS